MIHGDHNHVKIGVTNNPTARLRELRTASAFPLEFSFIGACNTSGIAIERKAHELLDQYRTHGEWFDCSPELAVSALYGSASKLGHKIAPVAPNMVDKVVAICAGESSEDTETPVGPVLRIFILIGVVLWAALIYAALSYVLGFS